MQNMKLVLQIALGVFLGTITSQLSIDGWHAHQEACSQGSGRKN